MLLILGSSLRIEPRRTTPAPPLFLTSSFLNRSDLIYKVRLPPVSPRLIISCSPSILPGRTQLFHAIVFLEAFHIAHLEPVYPMTVSSCIALPHNRYPAARRIYLLDHSPIPPLPSSTSEPSGPPRKTSVPSRSSCLLDSNDSPRVKVKERETSPPVPAPLLLGDYQDVVTAFKELGPTGSSTYWI